MSSSIWETIKRKLSRKSKTVTDPKPVKNNSEDKQQKENTSIGKSGRISVNKNARATISSDTFDTPQTQTTTPQVEVEQKSSIKNNSEDKQQKENISIGKSGRILVNKNARPTISRDAFDAPQMSADLEQKPKTHVEKLADNREQEQSKGSSVSF